MHRRGNHGLSQATGTVYQVDASRLCRLVEANERRSIYSSFGQFLRLASRDQENNSSLVLANQLDLISVAIDWNPARCTTSNVEDLVSIIDPFIHLRELFDQVTTSDSARDKQLNLIGLICFYGGTIEVFFSYDQSTSQWLFCFDGHVTRLHDWQAVIRKCTDSHLQPFLLIYANTEQSSINISQLLKRTVIESKISASESNLRSMTRKQGEQGQLHSFDNLAKISSFGTLNSSMLFAPRVSTTDGYITPNTVVKVMRQQLLRKESLLSTHLSRRREEKEKSDDADSSSSSQRDSGLGSAINDGSSDDSPRDSLVEQDLSFIDHSYPTCKPMANDPHFDRLLTTIEYHLEQSLKYESATHYSSALESCQYALTLVDQILNHHPPSNHGQAIYVRTKKNSLMLRLRSLKKRQVEQENSSYSSSSLRSSRPKKSVKFSDHIALIVPTRQEPDERPSEHLIHSFLREIHEQTTSDSDSDASLLSVDEIPIGLTECSLCHKRCSKSNQIGPFCGNCHFYMQRFQPATS